MTGGVHGTFSEDADIKTITQTTVAGHVIRMAQVDFRELDNTIAEI